MADHTGPRQVNFTTLEQLTSEDLNEMQQLSSRALQVVLRKLFQTYGSAVQNGMLDGGVVTPAASTALAVDVTAGLGFSDDAAGISDTELDSSYRWLEFAAETDVALAAADPTNPRIDVIYVQWAGGTWMQESRNVRPSAGDPAIPTNVDKRIGGEFTVSVATGTPAGSPSAPSIPANALKLAHVTVAAAATTSAGLTVSDQRTLLPTPSVPRQLADGTQVKGDLVVDDDLSADVITGNTLLSNGTMTAVGQVTGSNVATNSTSATTPALKARASRTGAPGAGEHAVVAAVERGTSADAQVRYEEDEDRWEADRGDGSGYHGLVLGMYQSDGTKYAGQQILLADTFSFNFSSAGANATFTATFSNLPSGAGTGKQTFQVTLRSAQDSDTRIEAVFGAGSATEIDVDIAFNRVGGGNLTDGAHTVEVLVITRLP